jgi:DNA polymerase III epsilon subunit family exonuclease
MGSRFAVIDFETTGLSPDNGDRITEVGIVIVESGKVLDQFESLVNTGRSIPYEVQSLTGITNQMTANAPSASLIIPQLYQYVKNSTLVAHNAIFDSKFFHSEMSKVGIRTNFDFICTLLLSRRLYQSLENHKLGTLAKHHGIKTQGRGHRALADALVTAELFIKISNDLKDHLSGNNLSAHHYLHSQKQPLSSFSKPSRRSNTSSIKPQPDVVKPLNKKASQQTPQARSISAAMASLTTNKPPSNTPSETKTAKTDSHLQHYEIVSWIKTSTGLKNKKTGLLIPFSNTLRDVFPVPGYQVKGNHPFGFIKDSDIDNSLPNESEKSSELIPQAMQKLRNFFKPDPIQNESKNQIKPKAVKGSQPKEGFGQKVFSSGSRYEGMFANGKFHGHGIYKWLDGSSYEGDWTDGEITGIGKKVFADGTIYSGTFLKGNLNGLGTHIFSPSGEWNGDQYSGAFVNGLREGLGTYTWSSGATYAGQWVANKICGQGTINLSDGTIETGTLIDGKLNGLGTKIWKLKDKSIDARYEGQFKDGLRHGHGLLNYSNGSIFDGNWDEDKRSGYGVLTWPNGDQYKGDWSNGKMTGKAILSWASGASYEGNFENFSRHGYGVYKNVNGDTFSGIWLANELDRECKYNDECGNSYDGGMREFQFHGHGTFIWANGSKYEGGFVSGLRQGTGTFISANNQKFSGLWKAGIIINAYDEWIEKQVDKFSARYKKLINLRQINDAHNTRWNALKHILNKNTELQEDYEKACQSIVEKLDVALADYDAFSEDFFIDIDKCYFCCCEESYTDQINERFDKRIEHITNLRNDLYKAYLDLL